MEAVLKVCVLIAFDSDNMIIEKKRFRLSSHYIYQAECFSLSRALKFAEAKKIKTLYKHSDSANALQSILNIIDHNQLNT